MQYQSSNEPSTTRHLNFLTCSKSHGRQSRFQFIYLLSFLRSRQLYVYHPFDNRLHVHEYSSLHHTYLTYHSSAKFSKPLITNCFTLRYIYYQLDYLVKHNVNSRAFECQNGDVLPFSFYAVHTNKLIRNPSQALTQDCVYLNSIICTCACSKCRLHEMIL